jgi:hypothetical protein
MHSHRKVTTSVAAFALFAFSSTTVLAATEQEITNALEALFAQAEDASIQLGTATTEGNAIVYRDSVFRSTSEGQEGEARIATITVTGGDVNAAGGLVADSVVAATIDASSDGDTITIGTIELTNVDITPGVDGADPKGQIESLEITDINALSQGQPPVSIASVQIDTADYVDDIPRSVSLAIEGIAVDVAAAGEMDPMAMQLQELGYERLVVGIYASANWDEASGRATVEDLTIDAEDVGSITITGEFGGFTPDVVALLSGPSPSPDAVSEITVAEATVTFSDASITGRLLDMQASQMGAGRAEFVEQITAALPLMLSVIGNPDFQNKLAGAASTFLRDPQNITISINPAQPVDVMTLMMTGQTSPETLPDVLNADVTANEDDDTE